MKPPPDPIEAAIASLRAMLVRFYERRHRVPRADAEDLAQSLILATIEAHRAGRFVIAPGTNPQRALQNYMLGGAWKALVNHREHPSRSRTDLGGVRDDAITYDPEPRHAAASMLRALDLPPIVMAFVTALVNTGNTHEAADALGWKHNTGHSRLHRLRADAAAQLRRIRARERR
ncbi:MAG: hypothetical protein R3B70_04510 [Polyangiaceae bacterium]